MRKLLPVSFLRTAGEAGFRSNIPRGKTDGSARRPLDTRPRPICHAAMTSPVTEHAAKSKRHTTFYLACGAEPATPMVFLHGWPELSISWRHQLPVFAGLGFRAIAPDMRGYGRSSTYPRHEDYAIGEIVADMIELLDAIGAEKAVWVGHDWGSPVVWSLAQHHPQRCHGVASLCVPYLPEGFGAEAVMLADRKIYPEDKFPAAQWDYRLFYRENFATARRLRKQRPRHGAGAVPRRLPGRQRQAGAHRLRARQWRLVRRTEYGTGRAARCRGAHRSRRRSLRRRA